MVRNLPKRTKNHRGEGAEAEKEDVLGLWLSRGILQQAFVLVHCCPLLLHPRLSLQGWLAATPFIAPAQLFEQPCSVNRINRSGSSSK